MTRGQKRICWIISIFLMLSALISINSSMTTATFHFLSALIINPIVVKIIGNLIYSKSGKFKLRYFTIIAAILFVVGIGFYTDDRNEYNNSTTMTESSPTIIENTEEIESHPSTTIPTICDIYSSDSDNVLINTLLYHYNETANTKITNMHEGKWYNAAASQSPHAVADVEDGVTIHITPPASGSSVNVTIEISGYSLDKSATYLSDFLYCLADANDEDSSSVYKDMQDPWKFGVARFNGFEVRYVQRSNGNIEIIMQGVPVYDR